MNHFSKDDWKKNRLGEAICQRTITTAIKLKARIRVGYCIYTVISFAFVEKPTNFPDAEDECAVVCLLFHESNFFSWKRFFSSMNFLRNCRLKFNEIEEIQLFCLYVGHSLEFNIFGHFFQSHIYSKIWYFWLGSLSGKNNSWYF